MANDPDKPIVSLSFSPDNDIPSIYVGSNGRTAGARWRIECPESMKSILAYSPARESISWRDAVEEMDEACPDHQHQAPKL